MQKLRGTALLSLVATLALASLAARPAAGSPNTLNATWKIAFVNSTNLKPPGSPTGPVHRFTLFAVNADGTGSRQLAASLFVGFDVPTWSPDGRRIAFVKRPDSGGSDSSDVFVVNFDGSGQRNLTRHPARDFAPAWSPDGRKIAFLRERRGGEAPRPGGYHELWVMNADGSGQRQLTKNTVRLVPSPRWSPDSRTILLDRDGDGDIWLISAEGTEQRNLTTIPAWDGRATWSPNGQRIVFVSDRDGNGEIYVMNADGSQQQRLTHGAASDSVPAWSPDGRRIVFVSNRDGNQEIYVMNADGSGQRRLTRTSAGEETPAWSPDGRKIGFIRLRDGKRNDEIYIMNPDGSGQRSLTRTPAREVAFAWSPRRT